MMKKSLCCISLELQDQGIKASTMTKTRFLALERKNAEKIVADRTLNNVYVTRKTLEHCAKNGWNYRISSGMMPLETLPEANLLLENTYNFSKIKQEFDLCAKIIKENKIRCSTHPDQFVVPASSNPKVVSKSIEELIMHGKMMDYFGLPKSYEAPINIHMNCYKGNIKDIALRFIDVYKTLPDNVRSRLVLENEDKPNSWKVDELYDLIYSNVGIPITYDNLHYRCNNGKLKSKEAVTVAMSTWQSYRPLFHFSDNDLTNTNPRAHADYVRNVPEEYIDIDADFEFEFKAKDLALRKFEKDFKI